MMSAKKCLSFVLAVVLLFSALPALPASAASAGTPAVAAAASSVSAVSTTLDGVKITWPAVEGAANYSLFYKTGSSSWKELTITPETSYTWSGAESGTQYSFMVRPRNSSGKIFGTMDKVGKSITYFATPEVTEVKTTLAGVNITWSTVKGAAKYSLFYKTPSTSWKELTATASHSYLWKKAKSGTEYTFMVRPRNSAGKIAGAIDQVGKSLIYYATPCITGLMATSSGVKVSWNEVGGAAEYSLFYKTGSGSWKTLTTTAATSYTWKSAKPDTKYAFMVRPRNAEGKIVGAIDNTGASLSYSASTTPKVTVTADPMGIKVTWTQVVDAAEYSLFRKTGSSSWEQIATVAGNEITLASVKSGTKYSFMVRPRNSAGKIFGAMDKVGVSITYYAAPTLASAASTSSGVKLTWNKVEGAPRYKVYMKNGSAGWKALGTTASTSYTWKTPTVGRMYSFCVQVVSADGKSLYSAKSATKSLTYDPPLPAMKELSRYDYFRKFMTEEQFRQAYNEAKKVVEPLKGLDREDQLMGIARELRYMFDFGGIEYSMTAPHYDDPYGYFVAKVASCAGCARATGLCLDLLGIPYEHVNEHLYTHQWARVKVGSEYWICDAYGLYCGPEPAEREHPYL